MPPPGFLDGVAAICKKHGLLMIMDEVQVTSCPIDEHGGVKDA